MHLTFPFAFVASTLSLAVLGGQPVLPSANRPEATKIHSVYAPLQVTKAQLLERKARNLSDGAQPNNLTPTAVFPQEAEEPSAQTSERLNRRFWRGDRVAFRRNRLFGYLTDCHQAILPHTQKIRNLCATRPSDPASAQTLGWALVAELQAILAVLLGCLRRIKGCDSAPAPSGIPGGSNASANDICQLIFKIMCEIRACCKLIASVSAQYEIVQKICGFPLQQINECLPNIPIVCGQFIGDVFTGLGRLFRTIPGFFVGMQFGFNGIAGILSRGNSFFNFSLSL